MGKWEIHKLSDVIDQTITGEWGTECNESIEGVKILRTTNFTNSGVINYDNVVQRNVSAKKIETKKLISEDIILEKSGGSDNQPVGRVVFFDKKTDDTYLCNNFTQVLRVDKDVAIPRYVFLFLHNAHRSGITELLQNKTTGIRNLQLKQYMAQSLPLPPKPIQQKIADALDKASALIEMRKAQIEKLDLLIKSQFIEMFGDPVTNPKGWEIGEIRDLVSDVKYGTSKPADENGKSVYLRMNNVTYNGNIDLTDLKYINITDEDYEKCVVRKGDILFNRTNSKELVGKTAVFKEDTPMIIAGYLIRVRTNDKANPEYISAFLNSTYGKKTLFDMCKSIVGQANINAQELQNIKIAKTPIELQNDFAIQVDIINQRIGLLKVSLERLELNYKALMQKCFSGEMF